MAASFKFKINSNMPFVFQRYFMGIQLQNLNRQISSCTICMAKAKHKKRNKNKHLSSTVNTGDSLNIIVPRKIERSPTTILEALSSTVKSDYNRPIYEVIDDPFLLPRSPGTLANFLASKESGRKAAQTMLSLYPDKFTPLWKEDLPDGFKYDPYQGYQFQEASEQALHERMKNKAVKDAIEVYQTCKQKGLNLSQETMENLLELLTVYNCEDPKKTSHIENYLETNMPDDKKFNTWMRGNAAEEVFNSLPEKTVTAYNLLLRGRASNFDAEAAFALYREMKELKLPVDLYTYNKLIALNSIDKESVQDVIQANKDILSDMHKAQVSPDVYTFNAALANLRIHSKWSETFQHALSLISEMKECGIEPELSTFAQFLMVFYYEKARTNKGDPKIFNMILDYMEGKEYEVKHEYDAMFFIKAMGAIESLFPDSSYALKLHKILQTGNNAMALEQRTIKFAYYIKLLQLVCELEDTDVVMEIHDSVVPHILFPPNGYQMILENIKMHEKYHYIPKLITDLLWNGSDFKIIDKYVDCMASKKYEPELQEKFSYISSLIIDDYLAVRERDNQRQKKSNKSSFSGSTLMNLMKIFLDNEDTNKAMDAFKLYKEDSKLLKTQPRGDVIASLTEYHISIKDFDNVKEFINIMFTIEKTKVPELVDQLLSSIEPTDLTEQDRNYYLVLKQDASTAQEKEKPKQKKGKQKSRN